MAWSYSLGFGPYGFEFPGLLGFTWRCTGHGKLPYLTRVRGFGYIQKSWSTWRISPKALVLEGCLENDIQFFFCL